MFGSRHLGLKLAGALTLAALFGVSSAVRGRDLNPSLHRLLATPERWDGEDIWFPAAALKAVQPGFLLIEADGLRLPVYGTLDAAPGDVVSLRGTFRARERRLELLSGRRVPSTSHLRWLVEAVSFLVLAWVLWNFWRHFRGPR